MFGFCWHCCFTQSTAHLEDFTIHYRLWLPLHLDATHLNHMHGQSLPYTQLSSFTSHRLLCMWLFLRACVQPQKERHRVRCVNEGHAWLRKHLPQELEDRRISKVETLRAAIYYIKHLRSLLDLNASGTEVSLGDAHNCAIHPTRSVSTLPSRLSFSSCDRCFLSHAGLRLHSALGTAPFADERWLKGVIKHTEESVKGKQESHV